MPLEFGDREVNLGGFECQANLLHLVLLRELKLCDRLSRLNAEGIGGAAGIFSNR